MVNKKVLVVTTYPFSNPQHGGQKRIRAIFDLYKESFVTVRQCAVFFKGFYSDYDKDDVVLGRSSEALVMQSPLTGDIVCGQAIYTDPAVKKKMTKILTDLRPDIIHIEQPFPYLGLKPLLEDLGLGPKLVFGSQNIEAPMKREILESTGAPESAIQEAEALITNLEEELSRDSDLVIACTEGDLEKHRAMGAQRLVLAQNGIAPIAGSQSATSFWRSQFKARDVKRLCLFVASAHPPSWTGFLQMVGKGLGFVPGDARIVIAGSVCDYFEGEINQDNLDIEDATFWLRAYSAGRLSEDRLGSLIQLSDVIILPIAEGGGSNLKTAEAILADKEVVATSHALRSFEWFRDFPNLWIADDAKTFRESIVEALDAKRQERTAEQKIQVRQVEWQNRLAGMIKEVKQL